MNTSTGNPETAATTLRRCHFCGGSSLRRSRLRATDVPWLLVLRWPVRCRRCSKRQHVFLTDARRIIAASAPHTPKQSSKDSWQSFTANESPALRSDKHDEGER
ncbi:MAG TPA: hypothetical protein VIJ79_05765 [Acidobacteriaceae bacterium]